jgi:hypothetical protein
MQDAVDISVYVAFDANYASNKLLYYATDNGVVGKVLLDGNNLSTATNSNVELKDGDLDACEATHSTLIVAPDNALYVGGTYSTTSGAITGTPTIAAGGKVQIIDDAGAGIGEITFDTATTIQGIVGTFIDGEVLLVIGDNLIVGGTGTTVTVQFK